MKRKITLLLSLTLLVTLLGACGSGTTSSKEIAFSKLFENDVIIFKGEGESFEGKEEGIAEVYICGADGTYSQYNTKSKKLDKLAQLNDEEVIEYITSSYDVYTLGNYKLGIKTDSTGNSTDTEGILVQATYNAGHANSREPGWIGYTGGTSSIGYFVGHVTVYDSSYMMFEKSGQYGSTVRYLIRDTEETKDKTVVFDAVGTDGIVVDMTAEEAFK
ncbi:MAG: hypothetical protein ACI4AD_07725 [Roseburia sp.]